jgi:hypothetical protein
VQQPLLIRAEAEVGVFHRLEQLPGLPAVLALDGAARVRPGHAAQNLDAVVPVGAQGGVLFDLFLSVGAQKKKTKKKTKSRFFLPTTNEKVKKRKKKKKKKKKKTEKIEILLETLSRPGPVERVLPDAELAKILQGSTDRRCGLGGAQFVVKDGPFVVGHVAVTAKELVDTDKSDFASNGVKRKHEFAHLVRAGEFPTAYTGKSSQFLPKIISFQILFQ